MGDESATDTIDYGVLDELVGYRLRRAQLAYFNSFSSFCGELGISLGLIGVIEIVQKNPGLTQTAVAQALGNDRSAMVAAVDKLEKRNLIERRSSIQDRRSYALYLTPYGEEYYRELMAKVLAHEASFYSLMNREDKEQLLDTLARLAGGIGSRLPT